MKDDVFFPPLLDEDAEVFKSIMSLFEEGREFITVSDVCEVCELRESVVRIKVVSFDVRDFIQTDGNRRDGELLYYENEFNSVFNQFDSALLG